MLAPFKGVGWIPSRLGLYNGNGPGHTRAGAVFTDTVLPTDAASQGVPSESQRLTWVRSTYSSTVTTGVSITFLPR